MSAVAAAWFRSGRPGAEHLVGRMLDAVPFRFPDARDSWSGGQVSLGHSLIRTTPECRYDRQPLRDPETGLVLTADARIDNRDQLLRELDFERERWPSTPDSELLLTAYRKWGADCCAHLVGAFAFVLWDGRSKELFLARDHLGVRPLYLHVSPDLVGVASALPSLVKLPGVDASANEEWLLDYFVRITAAPGETLFRSIRSVLPGHWMRIGRGTERHERYWAPDPARETRLESDEAYVEGLRERLHEAVRCRLRSDGPVAGELSGGLDSSGVCGVAASLLQEQNANVATFSHVLERSEVGQIFPFRDERTEAQSLVDHAGIQDHHWVTSRERGALRALDQGADLMGMPTMGVPVFSDLLLDRVADSGSRVLLTGVGGDEVISSSGSRALPDWARQGAWRRLYRHLAAQSTFGAVRAAYGLGTYWGRQHAPGLVSVLRRWRHRAADKTDRRLATWPTRLESAARTDLEERYRAQAQRPDDRLGEYQAWLLTHPAFTARLEVSVALGGARGVEYRHPLLDVRLIEFVLSVPSHQKVGDGWGRWLWRRALVGWVPEALRWRRDKGAATVPSAFRRSWMDRAAIRERLEAWESHDDAPLRFMNVARLLSILQRLSPGKENMLSGELGYIRRSAQLCGFIRPP